VPRSTAPRVRSVVRRRSESRWLRVDATQALRQVLDRSVARELAEWAFDQVGPFPFRRILTAVDHCQAKAEPSS